MFEKPGLGRATIEKQFNQLHISIPTKRNWFSMIFMLAWLGGWAFGEIMVIGQLFFSRNSPGIGIDWFLTFWLIAWTVGGGAVIMSLLGQIAGKEMINISGNQLEIRNAIWGIGKSRYYDIQRITDLGLDAKQSSFPFQDIKYFNFFNRSIGKIKFDYGFQTIHFAGSISEAEAKHIINELRENSNFNELNFSPSFH